MNGPNPPNTFSIVLTILHLQIQPESYSLKEMILKRFFVCLSFVWISCGGPPPLLKYQPENTPSSSDYPGQEAVVLEDFSKSDFFWHEDGQGYFTTVQREVIKIFSHPENHSNRFIYLGKGDELQRLDGFVLSPDGNIQKLDKQHILDQQGITDGVLLHSDAHIKKLVFPGVVPGSILFLETHTVRQSGLAIHDWEPQREIPVREARYILNAPLKLFISKKEGGHGWNWRYVTYNGSAVDPVRRSVRGSVVTYDWSFRDIPPLKNESFMPPRENFALKLAFAPPDFKTWTELGDLYLERYFRPKFKISPLIRRIADSLRTEHAKDRDFVRAALELVRSLRYVALNIGESGLEPDAPETVYQNRYGDCKGKTSLLLALLQSEGIPSWPALILTRKAGVTDSEFVSFHYNHMIAALRISPAETLWVDPTENVSPLGRLPAECTGREALLLSDGESRIVTTPFYASRDNAIKALTRVAIRPGQDTAYYECSIWLTGEPRRKALYQIHNEADATASLATAFLFSNTLGAFLVSPKHTEKGDTLELHFQLRYPLDRGNPQFPESPLSLIRLDPFISVPSRNFPLDLDFPFEASEDISLSLPKGFRHPVTEPLEMENALLRMSRSTDTSASGAWTRKRFSLLADIVPARDYPEFRSALETWQRRNSRFVFLTPEADRTQRSGQKIGGPRRGGAEPLP